ncbi:hypothetical protein [Sorangium atrum]|uniref:Protein kinase domain-containing protein n=1 Tax=Sorangium atrum TaxID=2995308 RepID=A0ABT5BU54_9BACT|nr:hypothetical protein [Sorangium aterium]MDC0676522.1 hypothetical protein [Sorangium aterium]
MGFTDDSRSRWLGRYENPRSIRRRDGLHVVAAARAGDAAPCVVIVPGPAASAARANTVFAEIERVHALLDHPLIPKVAARGVADGMPYIELACDAVIDGADLTGLLSDAGWKVPPGSAAGLVASLRRAMQAAHAVIDPKHGRPVCIGRVSCADVLFSREGRWYLVGYGRNAPLERAGEQQSHRVLEFQAPEVAAGGEPSPAGDELALSLLARSLCHAVQGSAASARGVDRSIRAMDLDSPGQLERRAPGAPAHARRGAEEADAAADLLHHLAPCSEAPDPEGFASLVASLLAGRPLPLDEQAAPACPPTLVLGCEVRWIAAKDGVKHTLGHALSRIVTALVDRHDEAPDASLSLQDLLEAGWPGERPVADAGANRVYVALTQLRRMGLRDVIERNEHGYRLAPRAVVRFVSPRTEGARPQDTRSAP